MTYSEIVKRPGIVIYPALGCEFDCGRCLIGREYLNASKAGTVRNALKDPLLHQTLRNAVPSHIIVLGGEPLLAPGLKDFMIEYAKQGHIFTLDSCLTVPTARVSEIFSCLPQESYAYSVITDNYVSEVSFEQFLENCQVLRDRKIPFYVQHFLVPDNLGIIDKRQAVLRENGITVCARPYDGDLRIGQNYPGAYTIEQLLEVLDRIVFTHDAVSLFGGIYTKGKPCRAGQDYIDWNHWINPEPGVVGGCPISPRHGLNISKTFFGTGNREPRPCPLDYCGKAVHLLKRNANLSSTYDLTGKVLEKTACAPGLEKTLSIIRQVMDDGYQLVNEERFLEVEAAHEKKKKRKIRI